MPKSPEFYEEMWREAKKHLPQWLYVSLLSSSRARAGGRAAHRKDEPDFFAKLALTEIKPSKLKEVSDEDLKAVWLRLNQWFANAKKRKAAVENFVNAGLWTKREMEARKMKVDESQFVEEIEALEELKKARKESVNGKPGQLPKLLESRLQKAPDEILLIRDWVSIAGSAAVTEKPNDFDVVIRSEYNNGKYEIDGSCLWVALRRFLAPDKKGPQMQLLGAPAGSFTDYVPAYDLVCRRRESEVVKVEPCPPEYPGQERVIKQAQAATAEIRAQAERSKKQDTLTVGEYFYQPKPTRPAFAEERQSLDRLKELYEERKDKWLPALVQKKYDGANHQIHKVGNTVRIFSEDGDDNTDRLPQLVEAVKKLKPSRLVLAAELDWWENKNHYPRERVAGYLAQKDKPDDVHIVANAYDVIYLDGDIHKEPYRERIQKLKSLGGGTMGVPVNRKINFAPAIEVNTPEELKNKTDEIRKLSGSEGIVAKQIDSSYRLDFTTRDDWVKYHNNTLVRGVVIKAKRTKGSAWVYSYGIRPGREKPAQLVEGKILPVGDTFSTSRKFSPGDKILIESETVNKIITPEGVRVTAWVPRVLGTYKEDPDTVDEAVNRAAKEFVLRVKKTDEKGDVVEYLPANVQKAKLEPQVPSVGPKNAEVAFVGASPGKTEAARKEPFVGQAGETFNDVYLEPLGLKRSQVLLTNAVPKLLTEDDGKVREPTVEEIKDWRDWLKAELEEKQPKIVVALGRTAESALGELRDFVLPHPSAVRRFGDRGEVARKLKQIKSKLQIEKQLPKPMLRPREEGGTRSTRAYDNWENNWHKMLPKSGKGQFIYQHHWRGLDEDQTKMSDEQLMNTDHSIHGDIRLQGEDGLWGFAVFLGRAEDNKGRKLNDKLIGWKEGDNIELAPKLLQPEEWLKVGDKAPLVTEPGETGATTEKYSKFFKIDKGIFELGVARKHMVEFFLDSEHLNGRYLFVYAPVAGRRRWLIDKPEDQTPLAERRDLADVLSELRRKNQKFLFWGKPDGPHEKYDVRTGRVVKQAEAVRIQKADPVKRIVYGVVLDPYGLNGKPEGDAHNDWMPPGEIEKTAHNYMKSSRVVGLQHGKKANANVVESWVEQYPTRREYLKAMRGERHKINRRQFGDDVLHSGAWVLGVELGEKEWELFEDGKINAFSPGGYGMRKPLVPSQMPQVEIIDLVERRAS